MVTVLAVTLLLLPSAADAATSVRAFTAARDLTLTRGSPPAGPATLVAHTLLKVPAGTNPGTAGTQRAGAIGAAGTTRNIPRCPVGPCTNAFRGVGTPHLKVGDFAELVTVSFAQPRAGTGPRGFDVHLGVRTAAGWITIEGYFSTGTTNAATPQTVHLQLYIDLRVTVAPTILAFDFATDACTSVGACP